VTAIEVARTRQVPRLLIAALVGRLPLGAAPLALLLFARESTSISIAGLIVGAYTAGVAVGQPMFARLADRWRQPPVIWLSTTISTIGFAVVATRGSLAESNAASIAALGSFAAGFGAPPFESCLRVLWKDVVEGHLVHSAYALDVATQEIIFVVGPLVTVGSFAAVGPPGGLIAAALTQAAGGAAFATAPAVRGWKGEAAAHHWAGPLRSAGIRVLLAATALIGLGVGATTVAVTAYAQAAGSRSYSGWLLAVQAAGALLGGLILASRAAGRLRAAVILLALGYAPLMLAPGLPVMVGLTAVSGVFLPLALTAIFITADAEAPAGTAAESFAWIATAFSVGSALGAPIDGALVETYSSLPLAFAVAPVAIGAAALVLIASKRR
jgi:predicted MFS family arabinose efflux permease